MRSIAVRSGDKFLTAIVDDEDFDYLSRHKWSLSRGKYAAAGVKINGRWETKTMHQLLLSRKEGYQIDHINRIPLDNRRENLRYCLPIENQRNRTVNRNNTSGYKGVKKDRNKWRASINVDGRRVHLGMFSNIESARAAYDRAALELHREFAAINLKGRPLDSNK